MKILITKSQLCKIISEQPESRFGPEQYMSHSERQDFYSGNSERAGAALMSGSKKQMEYLHSIDPHTLLTITQIGTAFIPIVGPVISMGIGLADAAMYWNKGDKKTAGLIGVFSMIPGVGGLASKLGLGQFTAKALGEIGKKISLGLKLSPVEIQVVNRVAQYKQLIQSEIAKLGESATINAGAKVAKATLKSQAKKEAIKQTIKQTGKTIAPYVAAGVGYSKGYDYVQKDTPKTKSQSEGYDWNFVRSSFGSSGTKEENELLNKAWAKGWRPGQVVPQELQTKEYQTVYNQEAQNINALQQLINQAK